MYKYTLKIFFIVLSLYLMVEIFPRISIFNKPITSTINVKELRERSNHNTNTSSSLSSSESYDGNGEITNDEKHLNNPSSNEAYIIVIDAGSTGSRAHIFRNSSSGAIVVEPDFKTSPGLSSYASSPERAGRSLDPLLEFAEGNIPNGTVAHLVLKATAGMRLLESGVRDAVMESVRSHLVECSSGSNDSGSGRIFFSVSAPEEDVRVIDGKEEGLLGWMAVNYLLHKQTTAASTTDAPRTYGVLEMGGGSIQVTMEIDGNDTPEQHVRPYFRSEAIGGTGRVYTHSFLGLGAESAREAVNDALVQHTTMTTVSNSIAYASGNATLIGVEKREDPCLQRGFVRNGTDGDLFHGVADAFPSGDYDGCASLIAQTLFAPSEDCHRDGEITTDHCLFNGLYAPWNTTYIVDDADTVQSNNSNTVPPTDDSSVMKWWAFENFFYGLLNLGLVGPEGGVVSIRSIGDSARHVCSLEWNAEDGDRRRCFLASYIYVFLTKGLRFDPQQTITVGNSIEGNDIDWAIMVAIQWLAKGTHVPKDGEGVDQRRRLYIRSASRIRSTPRNDQ